MGWLGTSVNNALIAAFDDEGDIVNEDQLTIPIPTSVAPGYTCCRTTAKRMWRS
jgi:hypothetical protein